MRSTAARPLSSLRTVRITSLPARASSNTVCQPMPLFAPITTATRPSCDRMSVALQVFMCKLRMSLRSGRQVTGFSAFDVKLARHSVTRCLPFDMIFDFGA